MTDIRNITLPAVHINHPNFSLNIDAIALTPGEILGIFGKSGAGKTSYLKQVREHFDSPRAYYMSQFDSLFEEITIRQNIELALAYSGKPASHFSNWENTYATMLHEFEVNKFLSKYPRQMSGGQRKRTEIARGLIMDPEILLLDEPFTGIGHLFEAVSTAHIMERTLNKRGATVIVSHDFDLLCKLSTRVLLVDDEGVIGFIPTNQPTWKPSDVRTAWTLGVENVVPTVLVQQFMRSKQSTWTTQPYIAFWASAVSWQAENTTPSDMLSLTIPQQAIIHKREYLLHGTLYTQVSVRTTENEQPIMFVGKGNISDNKDAALAIQDAAPLNDNTSIA